MRRVVKRRGTVAELISEVAEAGALMDSIAGRPLCESTGGEDAAALVSWIKSLSLKAGEDAAALVPWIEALSLKAGDDAGKGAAAFGSWIEAQNLKERERIAERRGTVAERWEEWGIKKIEVRWATFEDRWGTVREMHWDTFDRYFAEVCLQLRETGVLWTDVAKFLDRRTYTNLRLSCKAAKEKIDKTVCKPWPAPKDLYSRTNSRRGYNVYRACCGVYVSLDGSRMAVWTSARKAGELKPFKSTLTVGDQVHGQLGDPMPYSPWSVMWKPVFSPDSRILLFAPRKGPGINVRVFPVPDAKNGQTMASAEHGFTHEAFGGTKVRSLVFTGDNTIAYILRGSRTVRECKIEFGEGGQVEFNEHRILWRPPSWMDFGKAKLASSTGKSTTKNLLVLVAPGRDNDNGRDVAAAFCDCRTNATTIRRFAHCWLYDDFEFTSDGNGLLLLTEDSDLWHFNIEDDIYSITLKRRFDSTFDYAEYEGIHRGALGSISTLPSDASKILFNANENDNVLELDLNRDELDSLFYEESWNT